MQVLSIDEVEQVSGGDFDSCVAYSGFAGAIAGAVTGAIFDGNVGLGALGGLIGGSLIGMVGCGIYYSSK